MSKIFISICLCLNSITLFCQTTKPEVQIEYKADKDNEFNNGSKISFVNLAESQIDDLTILGKVWGFIKYYHPSIAEGNYNWDYELFRVMPPILNSKNKLERNNILSVWVDSIGKVENEEQKSNKHEIVKLNPDLAWIDNSILGEKLTLQLTKIKNVKRTGNSYYIGIVSGVGNPEIKNEKPYAEMKYPDAGFRMLCLYRYWNIVQYYFPYKNLIEENWNDVLKEFIPKFANSSNELDYKLTIMALIARIHDTHALAFLGKDITTNKYRGENNAPVEITFVEDKAVVTNYFDKTLGLKSGLKIGDVIEQINNKSVAEIIKEKLPFTSGSNYPTQLRNIAPHLLRTNDTVSTINYKRGDSKTTLNLKCFPSNKFDFKDYKKNYGDTCFKLVAPDVTYLFPGNIKDQYFLQFIPEILKSKGLIIDLRCYPKGNILFMLNEYLLPQKTTFARASYASIITPGLFTLSDSVESGKKNENYYKGKVVIIVNEETQSQAEFTAMAFKTAPGAIVIGSTTAGADGNASFFMLPGGIKTAISGIGVYYPDGKETQRIGIVPDIVVKPTIKGITENKDELLEKAIEIINEK